MADSTMSKAAKKNLKRRAKKKMSSGNTAGGEDKSGIDLEEIRDSLKAELDRAKLSKDHVLAGKLREQIWVLSDLIAGVRTAMTDEELQPILASLPLPSAEKETAPPSESSGLSEPEKRVRVLRKKLRQIDSLKEKQAKGETLEENQMKKIESESELQQEIEELEGLIANVALVR